jgi:hypothetical protein
MNLWPYPLPSAGVASEAVILVSDAQTFRHSPWPPPSRHLRPGSRCPVGSLAMVKAVETSRSGDWVCLIEYQHTKQPTHGTRLYRSQLWESDLRRFEIVKGEQLRPTLTSSQQAGKSTSNDTQSSLQRRGLHQLFDYSIYYPNT